MWNSMDKGFVVEGERPGTFGKLKGTHLGLSTGGGGM